MQRSFLWLPLVTGMGLLGSCTSASVDQSVEAITGGTACDGVELDAWRYYKPKSWTDANVTLAAGSLTFAVPSSIPATEGAPALRRVKFAFSLAGSGWTTCVYRGNGGSTYNFVRCNHQPPPHPDPDDNDDTDRPDSPGDPRPVAGTIVTADTFYLHVNGGDRTAGTTEAVLHLGGPVIDDGNACTVDTCDADGNITHTPINVDDGDSCTIDACDPATGPTHTLVDTPFCRGRAAFDDVDESGLHGNGRACSTCHVESDGFQLSSTTAEARYQAMLATGVDDPLFRPIDANDYRTNGDAASDYTNLRMGLVRITLPLPANVQLLDCGSANPCPASAQPTTETSVDVWRSVPSVLNVADTGPDGLAPAWARGPNTNGGYQLDARVDTLQDQATGAFFSHAQVTDTPAQGTLDDISAYEAALFSTPEPAQLTDLQAQGKVIFERACAQCHGGDYNSTPETVGRYVDIRTAYPRPTDPAGRWNFAQPAQLAGNVRTYQFTYADGFTVRKTTTDPGRALLTGFLYSAAAPVPPATCAHAPCGAATGDDFQKLDMPTLHGIANTAPYFHNNAAATLDDVLDHYDQLFLQLEATSPTSPVLSTTPGALDRPLKRVDQDGGVERAALLAYLAVI